MKKNQTRKIIKFRHQLNTASPPLKHRLKHHSHTSLKYLRGGNTSTISVKKFSLILNVNVPLHNWRQFPHVLSLVP